MRSYSWCPAVGHDLLHRRRGSRAQAHADSAGNKPRGTPLDLTEKRPQLPWPLILRRPLSPAPRGSVAGPGSGAPRLAPEQGGAAGQPGPTWPLQVTIPASPPSDAGRGVSSDVHLMHLLGTNCAGQLHYELATAPGLSRIFLMRRVMPPERGGTPAFLDDVS